MPIYEYRCDACGEEFEELVFGNDSSVKCPKCGSDRTGKLMSCCRHKNAGGGGGLGTASSASGGGGCSGCSGGNCSTCH